MKRVLFIAYAFPPGGGAGVQRTARFAKYLREFGWEPVVVAPEERTFSHDPLTLGVDRSFLAELPADLRVYRVPCIQPFGLLRLLKKLKLLWMYNFIVRPDEKLFWPLAAIPAALRAAREQPVDLIYQNAGPSDTVFTGYVLKRLLRKPWMLDIRDPWTLWALGRWPTRLHYMAERAVERRFLDAADAISFLGPTYRAEALAAHPGLDPRKCVVIPNGYDLSGMPPTAPRPATHALRIAHAGKFYDTWGSAQRTALSAALKRAYEATLGRLAFSPRQIDQEAAGPRALLQGLAALRDENPAVALQIEIEFIGSLHPNVRHLVAELRLESCVRMPGRLPHDECMARLLASDVLYLPMFAHRDGRPMGVLPLKTYEYMALGKPILAAVPPGDLRNTLERAGTALFVRPGDPAAFRDALRELHRRHASGGMSVAPDWDYIRRYQRRELTRRLAALFDATLDRTRPGSGSLLPDGPYA